VPSVEAASSLGAVPSVEAASSLGAVPSVEAAGPAQHEVPQHLAIEGGTVGEVGGEDVMMAFDGIFGDAPEDMDVDDGAASASAVTEESEGHGQETL
jgi:hypothetical protein